MCMVCMYIHTYIRNVCIPNTVVVNPFTYVHTVNVNTVCIMYVIVTTVDTVCMIRNDPRLLHNGDYSFICMIMYSYAVCYIYLLLQ
jgi:hypothetical protein